jgi:glycosyltransferase involved in cell wall biosynthesis
MLGVYMRILFVAMANSVHTAGWVNQLADTGWDIHVFDAMEGSLTPELKSVTAYTFYRPAESSCNVKKVHSILPLPRGVGFFGSRSKLLSRFLMPSRVDSLTRLIRHLEPDIIHSLEMQHESYPLLEVKRKLGGKFSIPWIYSSWGSDLYLFSDQPEHKERIKEVLDTCDYYIADCQRDVEIATKLGFKGEVLGVFPGIGGFDIASMKKLIHPQPPSIRKTIALKGYSGWAGRAIVALQALQLCADMLQGYTVVVYSANDEVEHVARYISRVTGISFEVLPHSPREKIVRLMGSSRLAIGMSISDGTPNSMLDAMVMGAFPIQSDTISTAEWITHGENGLLVPPEDPETLAVAIRQALSDDTLVDHAAKKNARITAERLDRSVIKPTVVAMYEKVATQGKEHSVR